MSVIPGTSLVLCTRDRPRLAAEALASVLAGGRLPEEILIVDQSRAADPELGGRAAAGGCRIRYLHTAPAGLCAALNLGIAEARHELVAVTHDDVRVPPDWFGTLIGALQAAGAGAVVSAPLLPERPAPVQAGMRLDARPAVHRRPGARDVLTAANMAVTRSAVRGAGGFDTRLGPGTPFHAAEDNEFALRLLRAGYAIHYVPEAWIIHRDWRAPRQYFALRWRYGIGQGGFYAKLLLAGDRYGAERMLRQLGYYAMRLPWRVARRPRRAAGDVLFVAGLLCGSVRWTARAFRGGGAG